MRPETRLLDYIDEMAPPVTTDEVVNRKRSLTRSWVRVAIAAAAVVVLLGGLVWLRLLDPSATPATVPSRTVPATVDDLTGEWQPMPLTISDPALQEMDEECLSFNLLPPGVSLVVADARGEGKVHLLYAGEDRQMGTCEAIVTSGGQIQTSPTSFTTEPVSDPPVEATELMVWGGSSSPGSARPEDRWQQIMGEAGIGIHQVIAQVPGLPPIVASLGGGWFSLWHPVDMDEQWDLLLVGLDNEGNVVAQSQWK